MGFRVSTLKMKDITRPSYPVTSAFANTCVSTGPYVVAPNIVLQVLDNLNCWQKKTKNSGPLWGAASERMWAT